MALHESLVELKDTLSSKTCKMDSQIGFFFFFFFFVLDIILTLLIIWLNMVQTELLIDVMNYK